MADDELATRAPEGDAMEQLSSSKDAEQSSGIPGDSKPDQGAASMGDHCVTDRPTPVGQTPTGAITKYNDIEVYVTKPADYPHQPSRLLILLTGGTGVHSTNNQLQADKYAAEGFLVVMPDQFGGDPAPTTTTTMPAEESPSIIEQVKLGVASVAKSFSIDMWLARHTPEKVLPILHKVITNVKEEFADAVANGGGIYAVGYCFGAKYALILAGENGGTTSATTDTEAEEGRALAGPQFKAIAIAHGTSITVEDMVGVRVPICIVAIEQDSLFPDDVRDKGKKAIEEHQVALDEIVYPNVPHGFAVLGDYSDEQIVEAQRQAFGQMLTWLKKH